MARVAVFGAGHVGLVTGACLAELGHEVTIKDVVEGERRPVAARRHSFHEAGLVALLGRNRARVSFTTDGAEARASADVLVVCVDTPPMASGDADLARVWSVVDDVGASDRPAVLVMKSTVPVGTGQVCKLVDADVVDVARAVGLDHRLGPHFLAAGLGCGGSCFPKDATALKQLASNSGYHFSSPPPSSR